MHNAFVVEVWIGFDADTVSWREICDDDMPFDAGAGGRDPPKKVNVE